MVVAVGASSVSHTTVCATTCWMSAGVAPALARTLPSLSNMITPRWRDSTSSSNRRRASSTSATRCSTSSRSACNSASAASTKSSSDTFRHLPCSFPPIRWIHQLDHRPIQEQRSVRGREVTERSGERDDKSPQLLEWSPIPAHPPPFPPPLLAHYPRDGTSIAARRRAARCVRELIRVCVSGVILSSGDDVWSREGGVGGGHDHRGRRACAF